MNIYAVCLKFSCTNLWFPFLCTRQTVVFFQVFNEDFTSKIWRIWNWMCEILFCNAHCFTFSQFCPISFITKLRIIANVKIFFIFSDSNHQRPTFLRVLKYIFICTQFSNNYDFENLSWNFQPWFECMLVLHWWLLPVSSLRHHPLIDISCF